MISAFFLTYILICSGVSKGSESSKLHQNILSPGAVDSGISSLQNTDSDQEKPQPSSSSGSIDPQFDPFMTGTLLSGPTTEVPWESDPAFKELQIKNQCMVLMAAYKTVLKDPLPGEEYNVHLAARYINGTVVKPGGYFSQNNKAGPYTVGRGFRKGPVYLGTRVSETIGGGVCKIASTLYNVTTLSDLAVIERHHHTMPVPYVPYGQDATVFYGCKDFQFKNTTEYPVLIMAKGVDNVLYIGFYGSEKPPEVKWHHQVLKVIKAPVYYQKNSTLAKGTRKMTHEGMDGAILRSWLTITMPDGTVKTKNLGKSYYDPLPYTIETNE